MCLAVINTGDLFFSMQADSLSNAGLFYFQGWGRERAQAERVTWAGLPGADLNRIL